MWRTYYCSIESPKEIRLLASYPTYSCVSLKFIYLLISEMKCNEMFISPKYSLKDSCFPLFFNCYSFYLPRLAWCLSFNSWLLCLKRVAIPLIDGTIAQIINFLAFFYFLIYFFTMLWVSVMDSKLISSLYCLSELRI